MLDLLLIRFAGLSPASFLKMILQQRFYLIDSVKFLKVLLFTEYVQWLVAL